MNFQKPAGNYFGYSCWNFILFSIYLLKFSRNIENDFQRILGNSLASFFWKWNVLEIWKRSGGISWNNPHKKKSRPLTTRALPATLNKPMLLSLLCIVSILGLLRTLNLMGLLNLPKLCVYRIFRLFWDFQVIWFFWVLWHLFLLRQIEDTLNYGNMFR